jgi:hypothetical protein
MKPSAHLYLPRSVIDRWLASAGSPTVQESPKGPPQVTQRRSALAGAAGANR